MDVTIAGHPKIPPPGKLLDKINLVTDALGHILAILVRMEFIGFSSRSQNTFPLLFPMYD